MTSWSPNWVRPPISTSAARSPRQLNDMLTKDSYTIVPLVDRGRLSGKAKTLGGVILNTWDSELWNASDWYRIKS